MHRWTGAAGSYCTAPSSFSLTARAASRSPPSMQGCGGGTAGGGGRGGGRLTRQPHSLRESARRLGSGSHTSCAACAGQRCAAKDGGPCFAVSSDDPQPLTLGGPAGPSAAAGAQRRQAPADDAVVHKAGGCGCADATAVAGWEWRREGGGSIREGMQLPKMLAAPPW